MRSAVRRRNASSAPLAARDSRLSSWESLRMRSSETTALPARHEAPGTARWNPSRCIAHVESLTATTRGLPSRPRSGVYGSSPSRHPTISSRFPIGEAAARGRSSSGTISTGSPEGRRTRQVRRSNGGASYPVRYRRSADGVTSSAESRARPIAWSGAGQSVGERGGGHVRPHDSRAPRRGLSPPGGQSLRRIGSLISWNAAGVVPRTSPSAWIGIGRVASRVMRLPLYSPTFGIRQVVALVQLGQSGEGLGPRAAEHENVEQPVARPGPRREAHAVVRVLAVRHHDVVRHAADLGVPDCHRDLWRP